MLFASRSIGNYTEPTAREALETFLDVIEEDPAGLVAAVWSKQRVVEVEQDNHPAAGMLA